MDLDSTLLRRVFAGTYIPELCMSECDPRDRPGLVDVHLNLERPRAAAGIVADGAFIEQHVGDVSRVCAADSNRTTTDVKPPKHHVS